MDSDHFYDSDDDRTVSSDDEDEGIGRDPSHKKQRNLEATYGIFLDEQLQGDSSSNGHNKQDRKRKGQLPAPVFVKKSKPDEQPSKQMFVSSINTEIDEPKAAPRDDAVSNQEIIDEEDDDVDARKQAEEANRQFFALLQKSKSSSLSRLASLRETSETSSNTNAWRDSTPVGASLGSGLGAVPKRFGQQSVSSWKQPRNAPMATWEKHTKGIGSKLLSKMGYSGIGGLGKNKGDNEHRKGISKPVQVKVRPANLGLGFGNFQEASQLKDNRLIEAQVRGIELKEELKAPENLTANNRKSSLPSVSDLMKDKPWRRGAMNNKRRPRRKVVSYTELLEIDKPMQIIDMRGPQTSILTDNDESSQVPIAEELLYNVSFLLNTYENKLHAASYDARLSQRKVQSMQSDIDEMQERYNQREERIVKLDRVASILNQIEALTASGDEHSIEKVQQLVRELGSTFTTQEREELQFSKTLVPALLGSALQSQLIDKWSPLEDPLDISKKVIESVLASADGPDGKDTIRLLLLNNILPKINTAWESSRWDPVQDIEGALDLYELLCTIVQGFNTFPNRDTNSVYGDESVLPIANETDEAQELASLVKEVLINETVYRKLLNAVNQWTPVLNEEGRLANRVDHWVLPWLPHLDQVALVHSLISECKRKVRSSVSFLQKNVEDDTAFCGIVLETLTPWRFIFKEKSIYDITGTLLVPRLSRYLARTMIEKDYLIQDWRGIDATIRLNESGLLSKHEFLSLLEGELLSRWSDVMYYWISLASWQVAETTKMIENYAAWKNRLFTSCISKQNPARLDAMVCRYFLAVLLMCRAASDSNADHLYTLAPYTTNYRVVLARRAREEKEKAADDLIRMDSGVVGRKDAELEARVRLHRQGYTPTFREVVTEFAQERDVLFQPRMGNNSTKDGKQVFNFGTVPVYLDSNVVFALQHGDWKPLALSQLAELAVRQAS
jgi:tuftelin-interacting protein 11